MDEDHVVSITSIPRRFRSSLVTAVETLGRQTFKCTILVNIPRAYRNWHTHVELPRELFKLPNVVVFEPTEDYGPATKLLGALEYARDHRFIRKIITLDDDLIVTHPRYLAYLAACGRALPDCAITIGGLRLRHPPYLAKNGLLARNNYRFVDIPAGFKGVVYPVAPLLQTDLPFSLMQKLPTGFFTEDDTYFGIILNALKVPLFAVPRVLGGRLPHIPGGGASAVGEFVAERATSDAALRHFAVDKGYLPAVNTRRLSMLEFARLVRAYLDHSLGA